MDSNIIEKLIFTEKLLANNDYKFYYFFDYIEDYFEPLIEYFIALGTIDLLNVYPCTKDFLKYVHNYKSQLVSENKHDFLNNSEHYFELFYKIGNNKQQRIINFIESTFVMKPLNLLTNSFMDSFDNDFDYFMEIQQNIIKELHESYLDTLINFIENRPEIHKINDDETYQIAVFYFNKDKKLIFY